MLQFAVKIWTGGYRPLVHIAALATLALGQAALAGDGAWAEGSRLASYRQVLDSGVDGFGGVKVAGFDGNSTSPDISADGRWVVFDSQASYFDELEFDEDKNNLDSDIYLHDVQTGKTVRVSVGKDGADANGHSYDPSISANGEWVAFESEATNLAPGLDKNGNTDVFRYKRSTGTITRVSVRSNGSEATGGDSTSASVADDGTVVFESYAGDMSFPVDDNNGKKDVFVRYLNGPTELVSLDTGDDQNGASANNVSYRPVISGNGKLVAFISMATDLVDWPNMTGDGKYNIYARDLEKEGKTQLVSIGKSDSRADDSSSDLSVSWWGRFIAFQSKAGNLVDNTDGGKSRIYIRELGQKLDDSSAQKTTLVDDGSRPDISNRVLLDGAYVSYVKSAKAYLFDRYESTTKVVSKVPGSSEEIPATDPAVSADGSYVAYQSASPYAKQNYLGRGLVTWEEEAVFGIASSLICKDTEGNPRECSGILVSGTGPSSPQPGPSDPDDSPGNPLIDVAKTDGQAGKPVGLTIKMKRPFDYHEFKGGEFLMPVGLGASTKIVKCTSAQAKSDSCPGSDDLKAALKPGKSLSAESPVTPDKDTSLVGFVHTDVIFINNLKDIPFYMNMPKKLGVTGGVYFGVPSPGEAGRLYAVIYDPDLMSEPIVVELHIELVENQYYRLKVKTSDIPNEIEDAKLTQYEAENGNGSIVKIYPLGTVYPNIEQITFTIWGQRKDKKGYPFMTNPTFNTDQKGKPAGLAQTMKAAEATITNYGGTQNYRSVKYITKDEQKLPFDPTIELKLSSTQPGSVTDLTTTVTKKLDVDPVQADIRKTVITLPKGLTVNSAAEVTPCSMDQAEAWECAAAGKPVGSAEVESPSLEQPLAGKIYLVDTEEGKPLKLVFYLTNDLVELKLFGEVRLNSDRRIEIKLDDIPPYPMTKFESTVEGLLKLGAVNCADLPAKLKGHATFTPWAEGLAGASVSPEIALDGPCDQDSKGTFTPKLAVKMDSTQAAASFGKLAISVSKAAADNALSDFNIRLPDGVAGDLDASEAKCSYQQALDQGCPDSARIGTATATGQIYAGKKIIVPGAVYNAQTEAGEVGRFLSIFELPELAGGGKFTQLSKVLAKENAKLITTETTGVPPEYALVNVEIEFDASKSTAADGPLLVNASSCGPSSFTLDATSFQGDESQVAQPYAASGCPLPFGPDLEATLSTLEQGAVPVIDTKIKSPLGQTAMRDMKLSFKGFQVNLGAKFATCTAVQYALAACPEDSKIAKLKAETWIFKEPLTGSTILGEGLKSAYIDLKGKVDLSYIGQVDIGTASDEVSLQVSGLPPVATGTTISTLLDSGIFKNPSKCKVASITLDATSYSDVTASDSEQFDFCKTEPTSTIDFKAKLKPPRAGAYTDASFTVSQPGSVVPLKSISIKLGAEKKRALKLSGKTVKKLARASKSGKKKTRIGLLTLKTEGAKPLKLKLVAGKNGKPKVVSKSKKLRKIKLALGKRKLSLKGLPENLIKGGAARKIKQVRIFLRGQRLKLLRNPSKAGPVNFSAKAQPFSGESMSGEFTVKVKS